MCGQFSEIIVFHLGMGAGFQVIQKADLDKYPFASARLGKKLIQRLNLVFYFAKSDIVWAFVDCTSCKNLARWKVISDTDWHARLWTAGPSPINYFNAWSDLALAYVT